jgi:hypothetical protein
MGKSTIAQTVAKNSHTRGCLGASFFFSRDDADCSKSNFVFSTIAHQLAAFHPIFKEQIAEAIAGYANPANASSYSQLTEFIVKPLKAGVAEGLSHVIVVLDALDECQDASLVVKLLTTEVVNLPLSLKFLVTSRPERHLEEILGESDHVRVLPLDVEDPTMKRDIIELFRVRLHEIAKSRKLSQDWPDGSDLVKLENRASGLFIWASTACNFIDAVNPQKKLRQLLDEKQPATLNQVDNLYKVVLDGCPWDDADFSRSYPLVMGTILAARSPLSVQAIDRLLGDQMDGTLSASILSHLPSVIRVEGDKELARILHPSFREFLIDSTRCQVQQYQISPAHHNCTLAICCLRAMSLSLTRNICSLDGSPLNSEVKDLDDRVGKYISEDLQYSCRFWVDHVVEANEGQSKRELGEMVNGFLQTHLPHWLEVMSLLGRTFEAVSCVQRLEKWIKVTVFSRMFPINQY